MNKSGLYINGNKVCGVGYINNGVHNGDISFQGSKIVIDDKEFDIKEYSNNQEAIQIEIFGNLQSLNSVSGDLTIKAENIGKVDNVNGDINIQANSVGSVSTVNGNIHTNRD